MFQFRSIRLTSLASTLLLLAASASAQGFKLSQGYLEPVISRANRPVTITVVLQNTTTLAAYDLAVQLNLPAGAVGLGASVGLTSNIPLLAGGEIKSVTWDVQSSVATNGTATLLVKQGATTKLTATFPVWWQSALTITNQDYAPAPVPVGTGRYLVGAMLCPFWRDTAHSSIYNYPDRKPALGYEDEGDFEATDWRVKWALEHGVSYFVPCWYRDPANVGNSPVVPEHHRWLEGGFLNGRYGSQAKFAIMSVGQLASSQGDLVTNVFPYWLENYFKRTNYLVIDNKPVVFFFETPLSPSVMTNALTEMRTAAQAAGFAGLYVLGCNNGFFGGSTTNNQWMKDAGMDYSFAYHLPTFMGTLSSANPSQGEVIGDHQQVWDNQQAGVVPNLLTVSSGWNSEPWGNSVSASKWRLSPANYTTLLNNARAELDSRTNSSSGLDTKMLLLDNWDEWGEGHFIGVTREYAWGYLDTLRSVFGTNLAPHTDLSPPDAGRGTPYFDGQDRAMQVLCSAGGLSISNGGTGSFQVRLSSAPTNNITVTNTISLDQTNATITGGASLTFTPADWNTPQSVTVSGLAATSRKIFAFSSAGGNSSYCDDWVQIIVHAAPTNPPSSGSWTLNANGNWSTATNWLGASVPSGENATANFTNSMAGSRTVTVDSSPGVIRSLVFSPNGGNNWTLTGGEIQLAPAATITVNANTTTINPKLNGMATLNKLGAGTLALGGPNNYTGGTVVQAGTVRANTTNALGFGAVTVGNGATVDANGKRLTVDFIASGAGDGGNGAIVNTSGTGAGIQNLALLGDVTMRDVFSGLNVWGGIAGGGWTLTVLGNGTAGYIGLGRGQSDLGDINIVSGALYANGYLPNVKDCFGRPTNTITISSSGTLGLVRNGSVTHRKRIVSNGGKIRQWDSVSGTPVLDGEITLNAATTFDVAETLTVTSQIGGTGSLTKITGGTLVLAGSNTFSGVTSINAGTLQIAHPLALQNSTLDYTPASGTLSFGSATNATIGTFSGSKNLALINNSGSAVALSIGQNGTTTTYSGVFSGGGSLIKLGAGQFTPTGTNTYSGGSTVQAGVLKAANTNSFGTQGFTVQSGGTLELNGLYFSSQDATVAGSGFDGNGALVNGTGIQARIRNLTLTADATLRSLGEGLNAMGTVTGNGRTLTVLGGSTGYIGIGNGASDLGEVNIVSGALYANGYLGAVSGSLGRSTNSVTVFAAGTLGFPNNGAATHNKKIVMNGGRILELLGGSPVLQGQFTLNTNALFDIADTLTVAGPIRGAAGLIKTNTGTLVLSGTNTFSGNISVSAGTLQLGVSGSIVSAPGVTIWNNATLNVASVTGGFVLSAGQVLGGNGTVVGNLATQGMLSPGASVGSLTNNGSATLGGTTLMELSKSGGVWTNDQFIVTGTLNYGGTLVVTNVDGNTLQLGDSFKLFNAFGYNGSFTNLVLPALSSPTLGWTNRLAVDGTLAVVNAISLAPMPLSFAVVGATLQLSWPADHVGWRLEAQTNSLSVGLNTNWTTVPGSAITNLVTLPVDTANETVFYRLTYP